MRPHVRRSFSSGANTAQRVAFMPVLRQEAGKEPFVLVLSKKPEDTFKGFITIEPFSGEVRKGESLFNASQRILLDGTGLTAGKSLDASTQDINKSNFQQSQGGDLFVAVEVDMRDPKNEGVHPGDKYAMQGDEVVVIRSPISELGQALNQLSSNGRVIDQRLHTFAVGAEIAAQALPSKGFAPASLESLGAVLGTVWMVGSIIVGGLFFSSNAGYTISLPGIIPVRGKHPEPQ